MILAILVLAAGGVSENAESPCARLLAELAAPASGHVAAAALDAGPACVPELAAHLADRGQTRYAAGYALSLLSSPQSQDALYATLARKPDVRLKAFAAMGAGSVRRPKDVAFLCEALRGAPFGGEWQPIEAASLSLMLHDAPECKKALEAAAMPSSLSGYAARAALRAAKTKPTCRARAGSGQDSEAVVVAVMNCGVPEAEEAPAFREAARSRVWRRTAAGWFPSETLGSDGAAFPEIVFRTVFGERGSRCLVSVGVTFGPLAGKGYDYLLEREGEDWVVIAIHSTWVS